MGEHDFRVRRAVLVDEDVHVTARDAQFWNVAADEHDHHVVAYSPLARTEVLDDPVLGDIAEKHDASVPQVTLSWIIDIGVAPVPKTTGAEHIRDNWGAYDVDLDAEDHERIAELDQGHREVDVAGAPWNN